MAGSDMGVPDEGSFLDVRAASETTNRKLGAEIRRIRMERGLTLVDIAEDTGLSASMLSMLERGKTGVSIGSLVAVASALDVAVGELFQPAKTPEHSLVRHSEQQAIAIGPGVTRRLIQRSRTHGLEVASLRLAPGAHTGVELVRHEGQEIVVVQTGRLSVQIGSTFHDLCAGDSIRLDADCPHRFANNGDEVSDALLVVRVSAPDKYGH
ncbi:cupin domain-containing protein [Mycobacterium sp. 236(2023)]|uniref:helix-turn-helix domain-containing protein n=1 Tax=Mycobacterium sp. 236(2023) TaxID=3038163 RepID=UPI00241586F7|nr:cupin domain-containing protein [Mycobacterium sp. 236(2023)]MDG4669278.1 cupin domain-containing protein [Mycobacterium sp. 236(2023)]